jgi:hypothetical protein
MAASSEGVESGIVVKLGGGRNFYKSELFCTAQPWRCERMYELYQKVEIAHSSGSTLDPIKGKT